MNRRPSDNQHDRHAIELLPDRKPKDLPANWRRVAVRDVGSVRLGRQRSPAKNTGEFSTPYIRAGNITWDGLDLDELFEMDFAPEEREIFALKSGDVVLAEASGSPKQVGRAAIWRDELSLCCFQNTVIRFRPHAVLPEYAACIFRHYGLSGVFGEVAKGIGLLHLGGRRFSEMPFPLAPMGEQERIVAALRERLSDLAEGRGLLKSALSAVAREEAKILATVAGAVGPDESRTSDEGTPLGRTVSLESAGGLTLGKALTRKTPRGAKPRPYLRVANIRENEIAWDDIKEMPFTEHEARRYELHIGDILLTEASGSPNQLGRPAMYRGELPGVCFQNHLIRFRCSARVDPDYALLIFRHYLRNGDFRPLARGSTSLGNLSRSRLAKLPFPLPPIEVQRGLASEANDALDASVAQRAAIESAVGRSEDLESAIFTAAAHGELVAQNEQEESAQALLARLGPPPADRASDDSRPMTLQKRTAPTTRGESTALAPLSERVRQAVLASNGPLSLPELCRAANVDTDNVGELEEFYAVLRAEVGNSIAVADTLDENASLRAMQDAT
jgi:restriction endonuclease S subunit